MTQGKYPDFANAVRQACAEELVNEVYNSGIPKIIDAETRECRQCSKVYFS